MKVKVRQELRKILKFECSGFTIKKFSELKYGEEKFPYCLLDSISRYEFLSEDFIREFQDILDWQRLSAYQKLSESFIREFQYKVHWSYISQFQVLSEEFIEEFKGRVAWGYISQHQELSPDFCIKFQDNLSLDSIRNKMFVHKKRVKIVLEDI